MPMIMYPAAGAPYGEKRKDGLECHLALWRYWGKLRGETEIKIMELLGKAERGETEKNKKK